MTLKIYWSVRWTILYETLILYFILRILHREKVPSNKTPVLTKSTNMGIWVIGTSNQAFIGGS